MYKIRYLYLVPLSAIITVSLRLRRRREAFGSIAGPLMEAPTGSGLQKPAGPRPRPLTVKKAVEWGTALWPLRTTCLFKALALATLLRRFGYPAVVVMGVFDPEERDRWLAHAWVEIPSGEAKPALRLVPKDHAHS